MGMVKFSRFDVLLVSLDPTLGFEIKKTRPCIIISPDEMNKYIRTFIVAPMTTQVKGYPTRISVTFDNKKGEIVLDQIRTIDKARIIKKIGKIDEECSMRVVETLKEMFS